MLTKQILSIAAFVAIGSVAANASASAARATYFPSSFSNIDTNCVDPESGKPTPVLTDLERQWYSAQLSAAREPSLYLKSTRRISHDGPTLRFTWLRSFHAPIIVRIEHLGSSHPRMVAKKLSGKGGYSPGSVNERLVRRLSQEEQKALRIALETTSVASMTPKSCYHGPAGMVMIQLDGAEWIIEVVDTKGYHFVDRWSPQRGGVHDLGLMVLRMTGWALKPIY